MGDRYFLTVTCPKCEYWQSNVFFAPTCGFTTWECPKCGCVVNLEELTGITYEDASNLTEIEELIAEIEGGEDNE